MDTPEFMPTDPTPSLQYSRAPSFIRRASALEQKVMQQPSENNYFRGYSDMHSAMRTPDLSPSLQKPQPVASPKCSTPPSLGSGKMPTSDPSSSEDFQNSECGSSLNNCKGETFNAEPDPYGSPYASRSLWREQSAEYSTARMKAQRVESGLGSHSAASSSAASIPFHQSLGGGVGEAEEGWMPQMEWHLIEDVSLEDIGESKYFRNGVFFAWRVFYAGLCFIACVEAWIAGRNGTFFGPLLSITYACVASAVALYRSVQCRLARNSVEDDDEEVSVKRPWSWLNVVLFQGTPVIGLSTGLALTVLTYLTLPPGSASFHFGGASFILFTIVFSFSIFDALISSWPTKALYILPATVINGISALIGILHVPHGAFVGGVVLFFVIFTLSFGIVVHGVNRGLMSYWSAGDDYQGDRHRSSSYPREHIIAPSSDLKFHSGQTAPRGSALRGNDSDNESLEIVEII